MCLPPMSYNEVAMFIRGVNVNVQSSARLMILNGIFFISQSDLQELLF